MATIKGTSGNDTKIGTSGTDSIYGYAGNDSLYGRAGNDSIWGADGIDKILGEDGNDILRGEAGADTIFGGNGDDALYGGIGNDFLYGEAGTDTVKGEAGNDVIKGGTGKAFLYGGDGNDSLYFGPTEADVSKIGTYFSGSVLNGDGGTDTLTVYNSAKIGATAPAYTNVYMGDGNEVGGYLFLSDHIGNSYKNGTSPDFGNPVGSFKGIEHLNLVGNGGATFISDYGMNPASVTGTAGKDFFMSSPSTTATTYKGGAGSDYFWVGPGDKIISESNDADTFSFSAATGGKTSTVTGFNGAGVKGGDVAHFYGSFPPPEKQVTEADGWTTFSFESGDTVLIQGVNLVSGLDYFIN